jgi:chaperonin GroEL
MANKTLFGKEGRAAVLKGIKTVHDATAMSLGARGRNAMFRQFGRPKITNDGVRIARQIDPEEPFEKMGADAVKEASEQTDSEAGDGTTTSIVLAYALIEEGIKAIEAGAHPMQLRHEMDQAVQNVLKELDHSAIKIKSLEELERIAVVSVENETLGKMIASAAWRAGIDGEVRIEEQEDPVWRREDVEGYRFDRGLISPFLITNPEKMEAVAENCPILITDRTFSLNNDVIPLVERMHKSGCKNLVIVAEDIEGEVLATLVKNSMSGVFRCILVKRPSNVDMLEDMAIVTGATAMTKIKGMVEPNQSYLGWADKVIATQHHTTIIGARGDKEKVEALIKDLKELHPTLEGYEKQKVKDRLAKLNGKFSIISIGAPTSTERWYLKLKADDAANACRCALEDGIVPGGGVALRDASFDSKMLVSIGSMVVQAAIRRPFTLIADNGWPSNELIYSVGHGENVKTGYAVDMIEEGITDPVKVTKSALANAASFAGMFLTTEAFTADIPQDESGHSKVS